MAKKRKDNKKSKKVTSIDTRLSSLEQRAKNDETLNFDEKMDALKEKELNIKRNNKAINALRWLLTICIGTILTYLLVVLGAQLTAVVVSQTLIAQSVLSSDAILVSSTAFVTSMIWVLVLKVKLYERIYNLFYKSRKEN